MSQPKHSFRCSRRYSRVEASAASSAVSPPGRGRARSMVSNGCRSQPQAQRLRASAAARSIRRRVLYTAVDGARRPFCQVHASSRATYHPHSANTLSASSPNKLEPTARIDLDQHNGRYSAPRRIGVRSHVCDQPTSRSGSTRPGRQPKTAWLIVLPEQPSKVMSGSHRSTDRRLHNPLAHG